MTAGFTPKYHRDDRVTAADYSAPIDEHKVLASRERHGHAEYLIVTLDGRSGYWVREAAIRPMPKEHR